MSSGAATVLEASLTEKQLPETFIPAVTSLTNTGIDVNFTLGIGAVPIAASDFLTFLQNAGYGNGGSSWGSFLTALLGQSVTDYQRYSLLRSDSELADQILTSDRADEMRLLAFPSSTSSSQIIFQPNTVLRFPTFVSIPSVSAQKFLVTFVFTIPAPVIGNPAS